MGYILSQILFYGIPLGALAFFVVSLVRFCGGRKANRLTPGAVPAEEMRVRKIMLVVSSVIVGLLAAVVIGFTVLLYMAVAFM
jgi:hypothetical protein